MNPQTAQFEDIRFLEDKLRSNQVPPDLYKKASAMIDRLIRLASAQGYSQEYDMVSRYLDWITSLPWAKRTEENLSLEHAKKILDSNHYGLENIKERILEYISVVNLKKGSSQELKQDFKIKAPALLLLGLVGTGKTTMAYSIAQTLGRQ